MTTAFGNTYYIDPLGQRLMKSVGSATTYFAPDENNHLIAENDSGLWVDYLWLNGRLIARIHGGQMEDIHLDQVGRPEAMTNADQTLAWRAGNTPFSRWIGTNNAVPLNIGFPGQYYDAELSLWNNGYRDYFPWVGRYLESDPIGLAGGINTYAYVGGNPLSRADPFGLAPPGAMPIGPFSPEPGYTVPIKLNYFSDSSLLYGHVGIGIGDKDSVGFYSTDPPIISALGIPTQGIMDLDGGKPVKTLTFEVTPVQASMAKGEMYRLFKNPGNFKAYSRNCAVVAEDILKKAEIPNVPDTIFPSHLVNQMGGAQ
jgi:RHS repeat-associated protein